LTAAARVLEERSWRTFESAEANTMRSERYDVRPTSHLRIFPQYSPSFRPTSHFRCGQVEVRGLVCLTVCVFVCITGKRLAYSCRGDTVKLGGNGCDATLLNFGRNWTKSLVTGPKFVPP